MANGKSEIDYCNKTMANRSRRFFAFFLANMKPREKERVYQPEWVCN